MQWNKSEPVSAEVPVNCFKFKRKEKLKCILIYNSIVGHIRIKAVSWNCEVKTIYFAKWNPITKVIYTSQITNVIYFYILLNFPFLGIRPHFL